MEWAEAEIVFPPFLKLHEPPIRSTISTERRTSSIFSDGIRTNYRRNRIAWNERFCANVRKTGPESIMSNTWVCRNRSFA